MSGFGDYDHLCEVLVPDNDRGSSGSVKRRWKSLFTFFASKADQGTSQFVAAEVTNVEVTTIFQTHYNADIKAHQRIVCDGVTYEMVGLPREIGRRAAMLIQAKSIPA